MNAQSIVSYARAIAKKISSTQYNDTTMVRVLNKAYKDFYKKVVDLDKNYFWTRWTANSVNWVYEYALKKPSAWVYGMFKPEKLRIKYTTTSDYIDVEFKDWDTLEETPERYATNQSKDEPFAIITDTNFIHIFPTPDVDVAWGLLFEGAKKPYDLTISSTEDEIVIDSLYHDAIAYMMVAEIEKERWDINAKNDAINEADRELKSALKSMWVLTTKAIRAKTKDLSDLE